MRLPEHDHVVETFPSDRADQFLRVRILPRRARGNGLCRGCQWLNRRVTAELAMQVVKNIRRATRRTKIQNFIYFVALVTARTSPTCRT